MRCRAKVFFTAMLLHVQGVHADSISVFNETEKMLYGRVYYESKFADDVRAVDDVVDLHPGVSTVVERPASRVGKDRKFAINPVRAALKDQFEKHEFVKVPSKLIGYTQGMRYYLAEKDDSFHVFNEIEWRVTMPTIKEFAKAKEWMLHATKKADEAIKIVVTGPLKEGLRKRLPAFNTQKYKVQKNQVATVRLGNELSRQENEALNARQITVQSAIEKKLGRKIAYTPKIAVATSGGGYRAMFGTLGFLSGAQSAGLLDTFTWAAATSGSTWALCAWLLHAGRDDRFISLKNFNPFFFNLMANKTLTSPALNQDEIKLLVESLLTGVVGKQSGTLVDVYGILLANRLFASEKEKRHVLYLSEQTGLVNAGRVPIPIFTAVRGESRLKKEDLQWYEFTPWEVGSAWLKMYIPTYSFGRLFDRGESKDTDPEKPLGFLLGTFGSAFAATVSDLYETIETKVKNPIIHTFLHEMFVTRYGHERLTWSVVDNFTKGMTKSPLRAQRTLRMVDAGLAFNLPYPPVSGQREERKPDILIFVDCSAEIDKDTNPLRGVIEYAKRNNLQLPPIDLNDIETQAISIFKNRKDLSVPVVIYLPRVLDETGKAMLNESEYSNFRQTLSGFDLNECLQTGYCSTYNFTYSGKDAAQFAALMEFNVSISADEIWREIKEIVERKQSQKESDLEDSSDQEEEQEDSLAGVTDDSDEQTTTEDEVETGE